MYILCLIAVGAICDDLIPETVICEPYPLIGRPVTCELVNTLAAEFFHVPILTICRERISAFDCNGGGNFEDYCRKSCSNCRINVFH